MGGRREDRLVIRLWESLFLVSGFLQRHSQKSEPSQEKRADCDPAELVFGAGKEDGEGWIPRSGREGEGKRHTFHWWPGKGGVLSMSCCCGELG